MKNFLALVILFTTVNTFAATTIHTVIKQNNHIVASWWEKFLHLDNSFPQKKYETRGIPLPNLNGDTKLGSIIYLTLKLDLISYDIKTNTYKFNISVSEPGIEKEDKYKSINADVYFDKTNSKNMVIVGTFKKVPVGVLEMPKINKESKEDFILSVDEMKDITISTQHDIPISIKLND